MELHKTDVAKRLRISHRTLELWCQRGYFPPPAYLGRRAFWSAAVVDRWITEKLSDLPAERHLT